MVGFLDGDDALHASADTAIRALIRDQQLLVSAVTYAEVLTGTRLGQRALRMPDALILATADLNPEVELIVSGDEDVAKVRGLRCSVRRLT